MSDMNKMGVFPESDCYVTPDKWEVIDKILAQSNIALEHRDMVGVSIAETMTHLAVENTAAEGVLSLYFSDGPESDALDRLRQGQATVADKLRILQSDIVAMSGVNSLELGRCHHFLQDEQEAERQIVDLVNEGIAEMDFRELLPRTLHKMRVHGRCYSDEEKTTISGIVISMKENIATKGDISVRHRSKAYLSTEEIMKFNQSDEDIDVQWKRLQRQLKRGCIDTDTLVAANIKKAILSHPENMLTSIYYGFRENKVNNTEVSLANAALHRLV